MTKVLIVTQAPSGGVGRHISNLIDGLNNQFDFFVLYNPEFADESFKNWLREHKNITRITTPYLVREISPNMDIKAINFIYRKIREIKPDVVHLHSSKAGAVGRVAAKLARAKKVIYTPHAYSFLSKEFSAKKSNFFVFIERVLSRYFTTTTINVSNSEKQAALAKKIDKNEKFIVVPNAIPTKKHDDVRKQRSRLGINDENVFMVGNIARVAEQKNPELFIRVARAVKEKDPSISFFWVGYKEKRLASYDFEKGIVNFVGEMVHTDELVSAFDLYFCTSIFEGMSYSLLEAADAGVPVLLSNVEGNNDFADIYTSAQLFELEDKPETIANKIINFKRDQIDKTGQITFSYKAMISAIKKIYLG
ncbi:glycosyltransferase [Pediococcus acidilactici]|uniref:glycosyltransferase n=2 Tax=Pediococcus acidilactici TaxID=1254 RepID=UPI0013296138|nr:glycosyltransferase [Pediococcus acidilactici]KAF0338472.1 glycosyltransferase [Pediococcus acidilactici]KAF0378352.1 glycosyltransferase [Pediococcus acidilactici]KAF0388298.1 glycosyltransferase [Pediococcus acidilactici]KAF0451470.1 glycosyltransferase [Pediococcus acidilactici]KAF0460779.1 glycosyltransferase [Pediococcus acidilactici]